MDEIIVSAKGKDTEVVLYKNRIEYTRKGLGGLMFHGMDGTKIIFLKSITGLQYLKNAYIQFIFQGSQENKKGAWAAATDENTIFFGKKESEKFEEIKNYIISQIP